MLVDVELLYAALDRLPNDQREAVVLFEVSGLPMAEIAAIQNCSEGTVKTRVSRGRAKLRGLLEGRVKSSPQVLNALTTILL